MIDERDLDALLGALAHELRTPLNALAGWLEVARLSLDRGMPVPEKALTGMARAIEQQTAQIAEFTVRRSPVRIGGASNGDLAAALDAAHGELRASAASPLLDSIGARSPLRCFDDGHLRQHAGLFLRACVQVCGADSLRARDERTAPDGLVLIGSAPPVDDAAWQVLTTGAGLQALAPEPRKLLLCWRARAALAGIGVAITGRLRPDAHPETTALRLEPIRQRPD